MLASIWFGTYNSAMKDRDSQVPILLVVGLSFAIRAALPVVAFLLSRDPGVFWAPDTSSYLEPATNLLRGSFAVKGVPELFRTPGYPLLLLPGVVLGHPIAAAIAIQVLLGAATVYLACETTRLVWKDPRAVLAAGLLCALEPLSLLYTSLLLSETAFTAALVCFIYTLVKYTEEGAPRFLVLAALCLAAATFIRPITYFLAPLVAVGLPFLSAKRPTRFGARFSLAMLFLLTAMAPLGLWQYRNWRVAGYSGFSAAGDYVLYYHAAMVLASKDRVPFEAAATNMGCWSEETFARLHPGLTGAGEKYEVMKREAVRIIESAPSAYFRVYVRGMVRMLVNPGGVSYLMLFSTAPGAPHVAQEASALGFLGGLRYTLQSRPALFWLDLGLGLANLAYLGLACVGAVRLVRSRLSMGVLILAVMFYFLFLTGPLGQSRHRQPIMPLVCLLAGIGLTGVALPLLRRKNRAGAASASGPGLVIECHSTAIFDEVQNELAEIGYDVRALPDQRTGREELKSSRTAYLYLQSNTY